MLWDASAINGYSIEASDGQLGTVSDLLFDDFGWIIRWLVVDTGHWLPGRKVLLPLSALGQPDRALRHFPVKLTMQQVKDSPNIDTDLPVSRQIEANLFGYYGWGPYWDSNAFLSNAMATPFVPPLYQPESQSLEPGGADVEPDHGDPHLRSMSAITGHHIHATDGMIGHVEDLLVDDAGWHIRYIIVDTKNWWPGKKVLISPLTVREIDWAERLVHLNVDCQKVKDGPEYDPTITVDGAYNDKFLTYYGIRWVEGTRRET